jgi:hypothetical protein
VRQTLCDGDLRCMGMRGVSFTSRLLVLGIFTVAVFLICSDNGSPVAHAQVSSMTSTTYYVATDGSDAAPGTEGEPFETIQRAASLVDAGDTVVVRAGRYAGFQLGWDFPQNGTATEPITSYCCGPR